MLTSSHPALLLKLTASLCFTFPFHSIHHMDLHNYVADGGHTLGVQLSNYKRTGTYSGGKTLGQLGIKNGLPGFDPSDATLQELAKAAYDHDPKVEGFTFVPALSTYETKVFIRPGTDVVVVAFKGTDPTNVNDLYTDLGLAVGHLSDSARVQRTREAIKTIQQAMPGKRLILTGHSLGGSLAREMSNEPVVKRAVGFNTGYEVASSGLIGTSFQLASKLYHDEHHDEFPRFDDYLNTRDIVSVGSRNKKKGKHTYYTRSWGLQAHKPTYFK